MRIPDAVVIGRPSPCAFAERTPIASMASESAASSAPASWLRVSAPMITTVPAPPAPIPACRRCSRCSRLRPSAACMPNYEYRANGGHVFVIQIDANPVSAGNIVPRIKEYSKRYRR